MSRMYGVTLNAFEEPVLVVGSKFRPAHKMKFVRRLLPQMSLYLNYQKTMKRNKLFIG